MQESKASKIPRWQSDLIKAQVPHLPVTALRRPHAFERRRPRRRRPSNPRRTSRTGTISARSWDAGAERPSWLSATEKRSPVSPSPAPLQRTRLVVAGTRRSWAAASARAARRLAEEEGWIFPAVHERAWPESARRGSECIGKQTLGGVSPRRVLGCRYSTERRGGGGPRSGLFALLGAVRGADCPHSARPLPTSAGARDDAPSLGRRERRVTARRLGACCAVDLCRFKGDTAHRGWTGWGRTARASPRLSRAPQTGPWPPIRAHRMT